MDKKNPPKGFKWAKGKAEKVIADRSKFSDLIKSAKTKAGDKKEDLKNVWSDFQTFLRLLKAYKNKRYKDVPWRTILYATAAVIYFVSPIDVVPDFIPIAGLIDDISVITFVAKALKSDLIKFKDWEEDEK